MKSILKQQTAPGLWPARYKSLDGWRALAALTVVCHHLQIGNRYNIGHIGVMAFFVISGYCIAAAAEACLHSGYGFGKYMTRRMRRIYPPYFFAVCFFVLTRLLKWKMGRGMQLSTSFLAWLQTLTLTQWLSLIAHPLSYASDNKHLFVAAFWSLNYEEQFYLVIGGLMLLSNRTGKPILWGILALLVPAFAWNLMHPALSYGFFLEYWVEFGLGTFVFYRLCSPLSPAMRRALDGGTFLLALGSGIAWDLQKGQGFAHQRSVYAEWFLTSSFALLLIALRSFDEAVLRSRIGGKLARFGILTYSLYLIHQFNETSAGGVAHLLLSVGVPRILKLPIEMLTMIGIAAAFWFLCERPFINKPLNRMDRSREGLPLIVPAGARG